MKRITSILFILMLSMGSVYAVTSVDSIRREMKHLKGKELLRAHKRMQMPREGHVSDSCIATTTTTNQTAFSSICQRHSNL